MNEQNIQIKRCAIYTRKSTDEGLDKEFNSLEAQFDACAAYIQSQSGKGWKLVDKHYDDGGYSGGNTNRPGLQELLRDVNGHKIDIVVVYKIDRISRSLKDFTELDGIFTKNDASMVSVTQQIDTSTSMGRMIINLLMSFAQFEREMTADRVRDKMAASRKKGMWTGGVIPYGYRNADRKLVVGPENAPKVLFAFQRYLANQSFLQTAQELNARFGNHHGDQRWNVMHVRTLLMQAWPAGRVKDTATGEIYEGQHEAIVPFEDWLAVQRIIESRRRTYEGARCESAAPLKHRKQQHQAVCIHPRRHPPCVCERRCAEQGLNFNQYRAVALHYARHRTAYIVPAGHKQPGRIFNLFHAVAAHFEYSDLVG